MELKKESFQLTKSDLLTLVDLIDKASMDDYKGIRLINNLEDLIELQDKLKREYFKDHDTILKNLFDFGPNGITLKNIESNKNDN